MNLIIKTFECAGHSLYQVGGSVRDELMGRIPNDIDFATDATPEQMMALGLEYWTTENGLAHGTVTFREDGVDYEVTTFRKDVSCDGRNATIAFADTIEEDLARRDFTMNAIARNVITGETIDPFDGEKDINHRTIRFVGNAKDRIAEDTLRALRAYRFLSRFGQGWKMDLQAVLACKNANLSNLSKERIRDELVKLFAGNPVFALSKMPSNLKRAMLPEFDDNDGGQWHAETCKMHMLLALSTACKIREEPLFRLSAYLHDIGKCVPEGTQVHNVDGVRLRSFLGHEPAGAEIVRKHMRSLRFSNDDIDYVVFLIANHGLMIGGMTEKVARRRLRKFGDKFEDLLALHFCDKSGNLASGLPLQSFSDFAKGHILTRMRDKIGAEAIAFTRTDLAVNGNDCIAKGLEGPAIGKALSRLFIEVDEGRLPNKREILLEAI